MSDGGGVMASRSMRSMLWLYEDARAHEDERVGLMMIGSIFLQAGGPDSRVEVRAWVSRTYHFDS